MSKLSKSEINRRYYEKKKQNQHTEAIEKVDNPINEITIEPSKSEYLKSEPLKSENLKSVESSSTCASAWQTKTENLKSDSETEEDEPEPNNDNFIRISQDELNDLIKFKINEHDKKSQKHFLDRKPEVKEPDKEKPKSSTNWMWSIGATILPIAITKLTPLIIQSIFQHGTQSKPPQPPPSHQTPTLSNFGNGPSSSNFILQ